MFFTQDDYRKIQEWLQRNSVKDTEFQEADIPLNGNEIITLTQNGHSRKVYLKDLIEQIFSLGITDFVNVSSLHDKYNITLNEAIQLVPHKSRKKGQVITFCNTDNVWKIYQFTGVKNQWNILDLWNDLFDWTTILDVNFGPDEEDITANKSEDNIKLSFKDRVYEPDSHSGLGYKILRKNIVTYNDPTQGELTKNILVQDKVAQSNTIYEIRYDFDLNNQTINIPENSVLQYKGGSLNNGKIVYNNTIIEGIERLNNVTTEGDYTYPYTGDESNPDEQLAPTLAQVRKLSTEVTNIADDEDLTKVFDSEKGQEVLQLKDRKYVQGTNSGMGYVILRKGKSFAEQVTKENTIYEIRYDFDLGGEEVEIPENCVLKFEGGSLKNGTVVFKDTDISSKKETLFIDVNFSGTCVINKFYAEWFGANRNIKNNQDFINYAINQLSNLSGNSTLVLSGTYHINDTIFLKSRVSIAGEVNPTISYIYQNSQSAVIIAEFDNNDKWAIDCKNNDEIMPYNKCSIEESDSPSLIGSIAVKNIYLRSYNSLGTGYKYGNIFGGIRLNGGVKHTISNVSISGFHVGLAMSYTWWNNLNSILIKAYSCCLYLGIYSTTNDFINFAADGLEGDSRLSEIVGSENWLPPYCTPKNIGVISNSGSTSFIGGSFELLSMISCVYSSSLFIREAYYENITDSLIYANKSKVYISNNKHTPVYHTLSSYGFFTNDYSIINVEDMQYSTFGSNDQKGLCYVNSVNGDTGIYWDSFQFDSETKRYINKTKHPNKVVKVPQTVFIGALSTNDTEKNPYIAQSLRLGGAPNQMIYITELNERFEYNDIDVYSTNLNGYLGSIVFKNKKLRFVKPKGYEPYMGCFEIDNCDLTFDHFLQNQENKPMFIVNGVNKLTFKAYIDTSKGPVIRIAGNTSVELYIKVSSDTHPLFSENAYENLDTSIKYTIVIESPNKRQVYSNTTPPTIGVTIGDFMIYQEKPIYYTGTKWVDATGVEV